ncbi:MAG: TRCF domain-containing protein, partial [Nitrospiria bacterium]
TLQMSFAGARDLSLIETAPADRLAIRTTLAPFDPLIIQQAIRRELARGGQIFFVHNRVLDIERIAERIRELVPEVRMVVGHGQLREHQLERVMATFLAGDADILLSTTIIESGLDIPSANTILINRADQFGLAELYQLRGRVGRSGRQAYTVLLIPPSASLSEEAHRRLEALQEFTELGSGFKIAARDLEIRGAGNLLGAEQSGHIASVGFDLYLKMIQEAVDTLRGAEPDPVIEPSLTLPVSAFIPETYLADAYHRLAFYKRLSSAETPEALAALRIELGDRFGPPPREATHLFDVMALKQLARRLAVSKLEVGGGKIMIATSPRSPLSPHLVDALLHAYPGTIRFLSEYAFLVTHQTEAWPDTYARLMDLLQRLGACDTQDAARPS